MKKQNVWKNTILLLLLLLIVYTVHRGSNHLKGEQSQWRKRSYYCFNSVKTWNYAGSHGGGVEGDSANVTLKNICFIPFLNEQKNMWFKQLASVGFKDFKSIINSRCCGSIVTRCQQLDFLTVTVNLHFTPHLIWQSNNSQCRHLQDLLITTISYMCPNRESRFVLEEHMNEFPRASKVKTGSTVARQEKQLSRVYF